MQANPGVPQEVTAVGYLEDLDGQDFLNSKKKKTQLNKTLLINCWEKFIEYGQEIIPRLNDDQYQQNRQTTIKHTHIKDVL